jgi:hypothetical protein
MKRFLIVFFAILSFVLASVNLINCGSEGGNGEHAPVIANLHYWPDWFTRDDGGGIVDVGVGLDFSDLGGDIAYARLLTYNSTEDLITDLAIEIIGAEGITEAHLSGSLDVDTSVVDTYRFDVYLADSNNSRSNTLSGTFAIYEKITLQGESVTNPEVILNWNDPYDGQKIFTVERSQSASEGFTKLVDVPAGSTNFVDTARNDLFGGNTYYYRVLARDAPLKYEGYGYSNVLEVTASSAVYDTPTLLEPSFELEKIATFPNAIKGVEIAADGDILVSASRNIYKVNKNTFASSFFSSSAGDSREVWDLAVDDSGKVFATVCQSEYNCDIVEIYADGTFAYLYTGSMSGSSIDAGASSNLFLGNPAGAIYEVDYNGYASTFLELSFGLPPVSATIFGVEAMDDGDLAFGDRYEGRVYKSDPGKEVATVANLPPYYLFSLAEGPSGTIYISGTWPDLSVMRLQDGVLSLLVTELDGMGSIGSLGVYGAFGMAVDSGGTLFVGSGKDLWKISSGS